MWPRPDPMLHIHKWLLNLWWEQVSLMYLQFLFRTAWIILAWHTKGRFPCNVESTWFFPSHASFNEKFRNWRPEIWSCKMAGRGGEKRGGEEGLTEYLLGGNRGARAAVRPTFEWPREQWLFWWSLPAAGKPFRAFAASTAPFPQVEGLQEASRESQGVGGVRTAAAGRSLTCTPASQGRIFQHRAPQSSQWCPDQLGFSTALSQLR